MRLIQLFIICLLVAACGSSDPTFMGVCETDKIYLPVGNAQNSTACTSPQRITWEGLPIGVDMDADIADSYEGSVDEAIDFWNSELDTTAFVRAGVALTVVHVVVGSASDDGDGATSFYRDEDGVLHALIEVRQPGDITEVYYIVAHELGHSLGLCHDPDDWLSIMYPKLDYAWDGVDQSGEPVDFRTIIVTDNDRTALRDQYL